MSLAKHILVVDDEAVSRTMASAFLLKGGYTVSAACSGTEAIEKARAESPDLIVLDLMMPELDGNAVCRQLQSGPETAGIPVIMLTGRAERETVLQAAEAGVADYLCKPINGPELLTRVERLLRKEAGQVTG